MGDVTALDSLHQRTILSFSKFKLRKVTPCLLMAACLICFSLPAQCKPTGKGMKGSSAVPQSKLPAEPEQSAYPALDRMEKFLFFRTYPGEDAESRLNRLDKEIFGEPLSASIEERTAKLDSVLAPRIKAKEDEEAQVSAQAAEASKVAAVAPEVQKPSADYAAERARIAAQAAREQEIKALLSEAANLWRSKKAAEALERFEQVLRLDPQNSEAHFSMGVIEESRGKLDRAASRYKQASTIDPDNPDYAEAIAAVQKKIQSSGSAVGPQAELKRLRDEAALAFKRGEYFSALDLYKQVDDKAPNQALTKFNIGTVYLMMKDHYNALDYYKQACKLESANQQFAKAYSDLQAEMKKTKQALEENNKIAQQWQQPGPANNAKSSGKKKDSKKSSPPPIVAYPGTSKNRASQAIPAYPSTGAQQSGGTLPGNGSPYAGQPPSNPGYSQTAYQPNPPVLPGYQPAFPQQPAQPANPGSYTAPASYQPQQPQATYRQPYQAAAPAYPQGQPYQQQSYPQQPIPQQPIPQQPIPQQSIPQQPYQQQQPYPPQQYSQTQQPYQQQQPYPQQQYSQPYPQQPYPPQQYSPTQQPYQQQQPYPQQQYSQPYPQQPYQPQQSVQQQQPQQPYQPGQFRPQAYPPAAGSPSAAPYQPPAQPAGLAQYGLKGRASNDGVLITSVGGGTRASQAGLNNGDIIRTVDGNEVTQPSQLEQVLAANASKQPLQMLIFRNGNLVVVNF